MKKKYKPPTKHKQSTKQKHPAEMSTSTSLSASSSVDTVSIKQKHFEQLEKILLTPLKDFISLQNLIREHDESTMRDFIVDHILRSIGAADITIVNSGEVGDIVTRRSPITYRRRSIVPRLKFS